MNETKQNISIAESLGETYHKPTPNEIASGSYHQYEPNFVGDLNQMRRVLVEKVAGDSETETKFLKALSEIIDRNSDDECRCVCERDMVLVIADCDWLAEAYLKTIDKWEED